jgi:ketosteroid isomerase-like protein
MKKATTLFLLVAILLSCSQRNNQVADNEAIVKQFFTYFNQHDWNKMAEMYSETADFKDPTLGKGIVKQTRAQTIQKYSELQNVFPDLHDEVIKTYPSGNNYVVVEFVSSGTAPDGAKFELPICSILHIENGKITQDFTYFDNFEE